jgi:hypothetical protein
LDKYTQISGYWESRARIGMGQKAQFGRPMPFLPPSQPDFRTIFPSPS